MSDSALALVETQDEEKALVLMSRANEVAAVCKAVVLKLAVDIKGKRYLPVEAWATIASAYACIPSIREVLEEERGVRAIAELKRHDGTVLASAEGFVGLDEPMWANRPLYARRAMAQTRAISRVCRTAFAFVVSLMDAGLQTTPLEEMPKSGDEEVAVVVPGKAVKPSGGERTAATKIPYGKSKDKYLCDVDDGQLKWLLGAAQKSVDSNDPKWGQQNKRWLEAVQAEVKRREQQ